MAGNDMRSAVRAGQFVEVLEDFNKRQGAKVAMTLLAFHENYVGPLEQRIAVLEHKMLPWWKRAWLWIRERVRVVREEEPVEAPEETPKEEPSVE